MKFLALFVCVCWPAVSAVGPEEDLINKCPEIIGKYPFDAEKFSGVWHMISYMPTGLPEEQCARMNVSARRSASGAATVLDYQLLYKLHGRHQTDALYSVAEGSKASESFAVFKEHGSDQWSGPYKKYVVATDYMTYAVTISCKQIFVAENMRVDRMMCAHVYSRDTCLPQNTLDALHSIMSSYDIDYNVFRLVDHSNC